MDAFGRKLRDETRPDLDVLRASINRKMDTLQSLYKRERVSRQHVAQDADTWARILQPACALQ